MGDFFDVITSKQSYLNIAYSILSFPLAIMYFVFAVTALSLGVGLIPIFIGIPVLTVSLLLCRKIMLLECILAEGFLNAEGSIANAWRKRMNNDSASVLNRAKETLFNPENWKAVVYIFIKFIYSIVSFTVTVTFASVSAGLVCAPFVFQVLSESMDISWHYFSLFRFLGYDLTMFQESIIYMFIGLLLSVVTFHVINILAYISSRLLAAFSNVPRSKNMETQLHAVK